jgi:hypothetical protein
MPGRLLLAVPPIAVPVLEVFRPGALLGTWARAMGELNAANVKFIFVLQKILVEFVQNFLAAQKLAPRALNKMRNSKIA